jgi:TolA-binding protein
MKLSKTSWITLIVGIIIICGLSLGWTYYQQNNQQKQLDDKLTQSKEKLAQINFDDLNAQKDQLTRQIEQNNTKIADVKTDLSSEEDSIDVTNTILEDAKNYNVDIVDMSSSGLSTESLLSIKCETLPVAIKALGNISDIASFTSSLQQKFPTSVVKVVQMKRVPPPSSTPSPTSTPAPTAPTSPPPPGFTPIVVVAPEKDFSADISLIIYNYEGE